MDAAIMRACVRGAHSLMMEIVSILRKEADCALYFVPLFLSIGIGLFFSADLHFSMVVTCIGVVCTIIVTLVAKVLATRSAILEVPYFIFAAVCVICIGYGASAFRTNYVRAPILHQATDELMLRGVVDAMDVHPNSVRLYLTHLKASQWDTALYGEIPKVVRINSHHNRRNMHVGIGDVVAVRCILLPPPKPALPGAFDFARNAYFKQMGAIGYAISMPRVVTVDNDDIDWIDVLLKENVVINKIRQTIASRIATHMESRESAIAKGILVGDSSAISENDWNALRVSGTAHLIAVSGMHIAVVSALVFFTVRFLLSLLPSVGLMYNSKKIAAIIAMLLTFLYLLLTGSPISGQRAFLMAVIVLVGIVLDREAHGLHCIAIAAIAILLLTPESLFSPSLQMSFAACLALIAYLKCSITYMRQLLPGLGLAAKLTIYVGSLLIASSLASIATTPFIMYHFQQFSPYSVLANLFCVPLSDLVFMPAGMLAIVLMPLRMEWLPLYIMKVGIRAMMWVSHYTSTLPKSIVHIPEMHNTGLIAASLALFLICISQTKIRYIVLPLVIYSVSSIYMQHELPAFVISGGGRLFATSLQVDERAVLVPSSLSTERYVRSVWKQMYGDDMDISNSINKYNIPNCNKDVCEWTRHNKTLFVIASRVGAELYDVEDHMICPQNTAIFINMYNNTKCDDAMANIVLKDLTKHGTHTIYMQQSAHSNQSVYSMVKHTLSHLLGVKLSDTFGENEWVFHVRRVDDDIASKFCAWC